MTDRPKVPADLIYPLPYFAEEFARQVRQGEQKAAVSRVAVVGLARNCDQHLAGNLQRLLQLAESFAGWRLHIETNDNDDGTDQVLADFCAAHRQATFTSQRLGRGHYSNEFAGRRTIALAEYRSACQRWVSESAADADFVIVIDFDSWGGWSHIGVMHGIGSIVATEDAFGMASVSLIQHERIAIGEDRKPSVEIGWAHYDAWAYRLNEYFDDYTAGLGGWKHSHLPAVGSRPFGVCSAFGGLAIYAAADYLAGTYDGRVDCEHVAFHRTIQERTGRSLYLNPAMRTVMHWMTDGRQHSND